MPGTKINFDPQDDGFQQLLARAKNPAALNKRLGKRLEVTLREHFLRRNQEPNKKNWPKQNFWSRIRAATAFAGADDKTATVTVADPAFAAKAHGGTIRPKRAKWLTIPLRAEAYGTPARLINQRLFFIIRKGKAWLGATEDGALRLYYRLVKKAVQKPDPQALPGPLTIHLALLETTSRYLAQAKNLNPE